MTIDLRDRYRGTLLGLTVGNALGVPVEGRSAAAIRDRWPGGVRDIDPQERDAPWDDDVAQAVILAEALVERGTLTLDDLAARFVRWYRESGRGIGILTSQVLGRLADGAPPTNAAREAWEASGRRSAGNGAVMRCAPVALRWSTEPERLVAETLVSAEITHADPRCGWSAAALNLALADCLDGAVPDVDVIAGILDKAPPEVTQTMRDVPGDVTEIGLDGLDMGYTVKTMQVGLWAAAADDTFEDALVAAIAAGGDTDTNGAVAGAVLGARHGASAIPARWLDAIPGRDRLTELAEGLLDASGSGHPPDRS